MAHVNRVLVVNAGSTSLKLSILSDGDVVAASSHISDWDGADVRSVAAFVADAAVAVDAVGHRVVHGGLSLRTATRLDPDVVERIRSLVPLAPLHQERALAGIAAASAALPDVPQVACFDTAYHATLPEAAATYALPLDWRKRWPLRRFGFHGLSHSYAASRAASLVDPPPGDAPLRVVTCHLGAGASLCASLDGRSVDTTMGFTPLEGLVMASRSGSVDPGLVVWLITSAGLSADEVRDGLEHDSGMAGLAGTPDMRQVIERASAGDAAARMAFDVYIHVLCREVAAMTASLGGLDALVFTGGVGENAPTVREAVVDRLSYLGPVPILVIEAREDLEIAHQTRAVLAGP
ncbi:MAG TPA: acetate/propionate family kinase [Acidimicrobiales bacterium]